MARAKPGPPPVGSAGPSGQVRLTTFAVIAVVGMVLVGVLDYVHPVPQAAIAALCIAAVAGAATYALCMPWRGAATAGLLLALIAGVWFFPPVHDKVVTAADKVTTFVSGLNDGDGKAGR